jgi:AcrR family transcriptional regulator
MSKSRARSKEAKDKQIQRIISEARELFFEVGTSGFSMRALAKRLEMSQSNLYNYYSSKRQLWYEIMSHDFSELEDKIQEIIMYHEGTFLDLLVKLAEFYFDFAEENYRRYKLMFVLPPPPVESQSTDEEKFEPQSILMLLNLLENAINQGLMKEIDAKKMSLFLWSVIHGTVLITNTIVFDPNSEISTFGSKEEFRTFVIEQLKDQMSQAISE